MLSAGSKAAYRRSWARLESFCKRVEQPAVFPVSVSMVALFTADLHEQKYAAATIASDLSAIAFVHKMLQQPNPCSDFLVVSLLRSTRRVVTVDSRAPVSRELLRRMIQRLYVEKGMCFEFVLFRAVFSVAFYGFCRIGELVVSGTADHRLRRRDVTLREREVEVVFRTYKHATSASRIVLQQNTGVCCPVRAVKEYLMLRPVQEGDAESPFFLSESGGDVRREHVVSRLKRLAHTLQAEGRFDGHSFRIGATCHAAAQGRSAAELQSLGRWKSNAYLRYLRGMAL